MLFLITLVILDWNLKTGKAKTGTKEKRARAEIERFLLQHTKVFCLKITIFRTPTLKYYIENELN